MKGLSTSYLRNAREGISSERIFTEARGPLQAADRAAAAAAQLAGPVGADVPRPQPPLRGRRPGAGSRRRRDRRDAPLGPAHGTRGRDRREPAVAGGAPALPRV